MPLRSSPVMALCSAVAQPVALNDVIWNVSGRNVSSALPSQSLSMVSQSSNCGVTSPTQAPG